MSTVTTGAYNIRNVRQQAVATLPDANDGTPITAGFASGINDVTGVAKWNVVKLSNGRYTIQNVGFSRYARVGSRAPERSIVEGRSNSQQWVIQETRVVGQYTIGTTDTNLFWHLVDGEESTSIVVDKSATDDRNWWVFEKA